MYSTAQLAKKYLHYYLAASNSKGHGMHSPFVFDFILHVLNGNGYQPPRSIEVLRNQLKSDKRRLQVQDLGAGSRVNTTNSRQVSQLAHAALKPKKYSQLLFRLARHYQPQTVLELGTSLGITTSYFSAAVPEASIVTIEGSDAVAAVATENFRKLAVNNVQLLKGNFDDQLPAAINILGNIDLAFIDGNHRYAPTLSYFHQLLPAFHNSSVLVFDDIHWSAEMENAWGEIKAHPSVRYTIDVFFLGFVFFRDEFKLKQHFSIRF